MRKRKGFTSTKMLVVIAVIMLLIAILLPMSKISHPTMSVINNGPLYIRLVGVRPDGGQYIYDPKGKKTDKTPIFYATSAQSWKPGSQYRDLIFEIPKVEDQSLLFVFPKIRISDTNRGLGGGLPSMFEQINDPSTLVYPLTFGRTYNDLFFFIRRKKHINYIDFTLRYFSGPRSQAICTFTGPFALNKTYKADQNLPYEATFRESYNTISTGIEMRLVTIKPFDSDTPIIMYDLQGRRYSLHSGSGHSGSRGMDLTYKVIPLSIDEIAAVTFGEPPYEITFKNIKVEYPNLPRRVLS
jgi:hypothetical protein